MKKFDLPELENPVNSNFKEESATLAWVAAVLVAVASFVGG